ncbi:unnamed protein product (macronuclear) [Paramecium tetraurelia]|uniref:Rab-GAP TBC domain-containing protein n=1 Tax=Paramecium tetraurelia TaxID=5888 RepID=A0EDD7_PARTE|nr:uncharacterized protein GSPATT00004173001 [Paramecium tetraurelia]CAK93304.1 unnamed protein product [Paramecium tetraurelia]|eukprot:XP_001460701.1 hypothetical protein (macronuclear) [Paramecium tetraurelia strain d4-2]
MDNSQYLQSLLDNIDNDQGYHKIREYGRTYGFHNIYYRRLIWTKLLGIDQQLPYQEKEKCLQHDQLLKDVNRSLNTITQVKNFKEIDQLRKCLMDVLDTIFSHYPNYSYYQGYHDVVSVLILVLGVEQGYRASVYAAQHFFKDYLDQELSTTITPQYQFIRILLLRFSKDTNNQKLNGIMTIIEHPTCVIPWILTWFSHSLENINDISRVWDFLFCSSQNTILYICAAFIAIHHETLEVTDEDDLVGEFQDFFQNLNNKERIQDIRLESVLQLAYMLEDKYKFEPICQQENIQFSQNSIVYQHNFKSQLSYYNSSDKLYKSIPKKVINYIHDKSDIILNIGGAALTYLIQYYIVKI